MNLASPAPNYNVTDQAQLRRALMTADNQNRKAGQNVELRAESLILRSPNGDRWKITVSNSGVVSASAL